ncbi:hypothetical protein TOPH_08278 [Tolypocladium ophioglossoides CBS 100239]|uniref:Tetraspanin Tsp3 n=1 Tax=Tolypocladium ophioglossoides (strain CBS 100239) TaxID=1163406 RepID=A0A0L0MZ77_TOLOC|nr:hypothetical protein TOPH_08278 [Tolypocladium ophioglossoides CBS 100239]
MAMWLLIYPLLALLLFGVALYEHVNAATLSIPISPALTIITMVLPLLAATNAIFYPRLRRWASSTAPRRVLAMTLQALQAIVTTVMATLFFSMIVPSAARTCLLSTTWQRLFSTHDADSIRRIQDAFACCGFNTVRDRAWPFPSQQTSRQCTETYGRHTACAGPWQAALQRNVGLEFGVVLAVALLQLASLFLVGTPNSVSFNSMSTRRILQHRAENEAERARLLPRATGTTYGGDASEHEVEQNDQNNTANGHGPGRVIEPSSANPWG